MFFVQRLSQGFMSALALCFFFSLHAVSTHSAEAYDQPSATPFPTDTPPTQPVCGDGNVDADEECDDGNTEDGDGCSSACEIEPRCGDGSIDPGEECDDRNSRNGDGCSSECKIEAFCEINGKCCEPDIPGSGWCGPYNIYSNNCHNAANSGGARRLRRNIIPASILIHQAAARGKGDHTVNYTYHECEDSEDPNCARVCLSEPQSETEGIELECEDGSGETVSSGTCCWEQEKSKEPLTEEGDPGHQCYQQRCGCQAKPEGGSALPPGEYWPTPVQSPAQCFFDHGGGNNNSCRNCCAKEARYWEHYVNATTTCRGAALTGDQRAARRAEQEEFLKKCRGHCGLPPHEDPEPYQDSKLL